MNHQAENDEFDVTCDTDSEEFTNFTGASCNFAIDDIIVIEYLLAQCFCTTLCDMLQALNFDSRMIEKFFQVYKMWERQHVINTLMSTDFDYYEFSEYICSHFDRGFQFLNGNLPQMIDYDEDFVDFRFKLYTLHVISMIQRNEMAHEIFEFMKENLMPYKHKENIYYRKVIDKLAMFTLMGAKKEVSADAEGQEKCGQNNVKDTLSFERFKSQLYRASLANKMNYLLLDLEFSAIHFFQSTYKLPEFIKKHEIYKGTPLFDAEKYIERMKEMYKGTNAQNGHDHYGDKRYEFPLNSDGETKVDIIGLINVSQMLQSAPLTFTSATWNYNELKNVEMRKSQQEDMLLSQDNTFYHVYKPRIAELFSASELETHLAERYAME